MILLQKDIFMHLTKVCLNVNLFYADPFFAFLVFLFSLNTVKPVLSSHSKKDQKLVFKTDYSLMEVKNIAECSKRAFCNTFDLH